MNRRTLLAVCLAVIATALSCLPIDAACPNPTASPRWLVVWRVGNGAGAEQFRCIITGRATPGA